MQSRKLSEHVEDELFNKEKRVTVDPKKVIKTTPKIVKEYTFGSVPPPVKKKNQGDFLSEESKSKIVKTITNTGEYVTPIKKKKPYYRKKYNKSKPIEIIPEPVNTHDFSKGLLVGLILGILISSIFNILT